MKKHLILIFIILVQFAHHALAQCSGTPAAGGVSATQLSSCTTFTSDLSLPGASFGPDITYQWQSSTDGVTFTPVSGATNATYTATITATTYYNAIITCTTSTLSATTTDATLSLSPVAPITGFPAACAGFSTDLDDVTPGGTWSSSNTSVATINNTTGVVTGISAGTSIISYFTAPGCSATVTVIILSLPPAISGINTVCVASTTTLDDAVTGGTWTSSNPLIATVAGTTGIVTGQGAGTAIITYTAPTGCFNIRQVTVNPLPAAIIGTPVVCEGATTNFADGTAGGAWTSSNYGVANVGVVTGVVSGLVAGTATISYTLVLTGCSATQTITVNQSPAAITGTPHVCIGQTATLIEALTGGSWSSSMTSVATVGTSGIVHGIALGTSVISYTLPTTGCAAYMTVTVHPLPAIFSITGGGSYCAGGTGATIGLSGSEIGVTYNANTGSTTSPSITGTGAAISFGPLPVAGVYTAVATGAISGCQSIMSGTVAVTITPLTTPTVGITTATGDSVCEGSVITFLPTPFYGGAGATYSWQVNGISVGPGSTYSFIPADSDIVRVVMTSDSACRAVDTAVGIIAVRVLSHGAPTVTETVSPSDTICQHNLAVFIPHSTFQGTTPRYAWSVNGSIIDSSATFTYEPTDGDNVRVRLISNYLCRTSDTAFSGNINMHVAPLLIPHIGIISAHHLMIKHGELDTLTAIPTNAGPTPTFQWQVNGTDVPGATTNVFVSTFNNYDSVSCVMVSSGVCSGIPTFDWVFITITDVGVPSLATFAEVQLMPNPNKGSFMVKGMLATTSDEAITLEVTDMLGQVVYSSASTAIRGHINEQITGRNLANGMYILNVHSAGDSKVFHFVVEQ
jgi:uncharacterized protein YjdB